MSEITNQTGVNQYFMYQVIGADTLILKFVSRSLR